MTERFTLQQNYQTLLLARSAGAFSGHDGLSLTFGVNNLDSTVHYHVTIRPRKRRADGTVGKRAERPVHFSGTSAELVLYEASRWVRHNYPELV